MELQRDIRALALPLVALLAALLLAAMVPRPTQASLRDPELPVPELTVDGHVAHRLKVYVPPGFTVHYTLDGSLPDARSPQANGHIAAEPDPRRTSRLLRQPSSIQWRHPVGDFPSGTVVRACACDREGLCGPVVTRTLGIDAQRDGLPVFSLALPEGALFDPDSGIYTIGHGIMRTNEPAVARFPRDQRWWKYPGNYQFRGRRWERSAHLTMIADKGLGIWKGDVRVRIHGNNTRGFAQHALRVYMPKERKDDVGLDLPRTLLLRTGGNDQDKAFMRDAVVHEACRELGLWHTDAWPVVVYLNGAYWGIHEKRERLDNERMAHGFRVKPKPKHIAILADRALPWRADSVEAKRFLWRLARIERAAQSAGVADTAAQWIDVEQFLTYMASQMIVGNTDWPDQNVKYWRYTGPEPEAGTARDGRWRFILGDCDVALGYATGPDVDVLEQVMTKQGPVARLFRAVMADPVARERFHRTITELLAGDLSPVRIVALIDRHAAELEPAMPMHIRRWRRPASMEAWHTEVERMRDFARQRPPFVKEQLDRHLPLR
ncbi:MAG: CotH kinase family protein [Flavobacteriales bacterium]|nr:CotH kinase family protein [Flavobacteriales bacterium]